ncbi:hypothetical protein [Leptolyngbya ohadii]|uniref:hypothetical protein n=1 Tax=Leptolyngbya ohadii TaxID=1962290 RepID=UPI000B5A0DB1|nr:hypothetical protein [Leptolyngbya ohadii]
MTYPTEPQLAVGQLLHDRFEREAVKLLLIGNPAAVEQCIIELERKGFCDSYAWSASLPINANSAIVVPRPGEEMRLYKRWYPPTVQRIPL